MRRRCSCRESDGGFSSRERGNTMPSQGEQALAIHGGNEFIGKATMQTDSASSPKASSPIAPVFLEALPLLGSIAKWASPRGNRPTGTDLASRAAAASTSRVDYSQARVM